MQFYANCAVLKYMYMCSLKNEMLKFIRNEFQIKTSGYATWFTAGGAIRIAHYDVIDDVITRKL